jgi:L-threonylcarbamoyladenylate synthase
VKVVIPSQMVRSSTVESPGTLESHYAPRTPLRFFDRKDLFEECLVARGAHSSKRVAVLIGSALDAQKNGLNLEQVTWPKWILSSNDSDVEAAAALFSTMRTIDAQGFDEILCFLSLDLGLWRAVRDRLLRASTR